MTRQQSRLLHFLRRRERDGEPVPSFEEMQRHMGYASKSNIHRLIVALEAQGLIERHQHMARAIRVVDRPPQMAAIRRAIAVLEAGQPDAALAELKRAVASTGARA